MKTPILCLATCLCLAACGGGEDPYAKNPEDKKPPAKKPAAPPEPQPEASEKARQAALERLDIMMEITAVLEPLRQPQAALDKEEVLKGLFTKYNELGRVVHAEGFDARQLAILTAEVAPDDWRDIRTEFQQYLLLVRQLGQPQKDMMDRVMQAGTAEPKQHESPDALKNHLEGLENSAPGGKRPKAEPKPEE